MSAHIDLINSSKNRRTQDQILIRRAQQEDVQRIVHIYLEGFESSWGHSPTRSAEDYFGMLRLALSPHSETLVCGWRQRTTVLSAGRHCKT